MTKREARDHSVNMLERVGISDASKRFGQYAFQLSGGMRQRAMIAMALSTQPKLLIADEPTTALDVTIQAQVIDLMKDLVSEFHMGIIFITHDLGVIAQTADWVAVMYLGRIVESGAGPRRHPQPGASLTRAGLIRALPDIEDLDAPLIPVPGDIPSPLDRPAGCVFHTRCPEIVRGRCNIAVPRMTTLKEGHTAACIRCRGRAGACRMTEKPIMSVRDSRGPLPDRRRPASARKRSCRPSRASASTFPAARSSVWSASRGPARPRSAAPC